MKIRSGFVSNSSSSSFIISVKEGSCPTCGNNILQLLKLISDSKSLYCDDTQIRSEGGEEVKRYLRKDCWYDEEVEEDVKELARLEEKIDREEKAGNKILHIQVSYSDEFLEKLIKNSSEIKIIQGD